MAQRNLSLSTHIHVSKTLLFSGLGAHGEHLCFRSIIDTFSATNPNLSLLKPLFSCGLILELINIHKCSSGS